MKTAIARLQQQGIDEARLTVELLLAHALKCQRIVLYTESDRPVGPEDERSFDALLKRREQREPFQYIVGSTSFMGLQFRVDGRVLIPRPETETLVEQVIIDLKAMPPTVPPRLLDIGTGCGNIAVTLAKFVHSAVVTALDRSSEALEVARLNARVHEVESSVRFVEADVLGTQEALGDERFTHIVSNPPYGSLAEWSSLEPEIRVYEPKEAVTDGADGYTFHRRIAELAPSLLVEEGKVFLEVGDGQAEEVARILKARGALQTSVIADLQGVPRVVSAIFKPIAHPGPSRN